MQLNESYVYKKSENLITIEKEIKLLQDFCRNHPDCTKNVKQSTADTITKHLDVMSAALVDEFNLDPSSGFKIYCQSKFKFQVMNWITNKAINACENGNIDNIINISNGRVRFKKDDICYAEVEISSGVFTNRKITSEMIMGGLLHEFGHCFQTPVRCLTYRLETINKFCKLADILQTHKVYTGLDKAETNDFLVKCLANLSMGLDSNTRDEQFADQFAASYGYGKGCAMFLSLIEDNNYKAFNKMNIFTQLSTAMDQTLASLLVGDPHPSYIKRMNYILFIMKKEAKNKDIPKRYRKDLDQQIKDLENNINNILAIQQDDSIRTRLRKMMNNVSFTTKYSDDELKELSGKSSYNQTIGLDYKEGG